MRKLILILAFLVMDLSAASDIQPGWASWTANVWSLYCELRREYSIPYRSDPNSRGFLSGTAFDKIFVRFTAHTRLHGDVIPEDALGVIRFGMHIYPSDRLVPEDDRIQIANIGGFEVEARGVTVADIQMFTLHEDESLVLLQRFINNEVIDFSLRFTSGDERQFKIYPSGDRNFYVWAEMFRTCIKENST